MSTNSYDGLSRARRHDGHKAAKFPVPLTTSQPLDSCLISSWTPQKHLGTRESGYGERQALENEAERSKKPSFYLRGTKYSQQQRHNRSRVTETARDEESTARSPARTDREPPEPEALDSPSHRSRLKKRRASCSLDCDDEDSEREAKTAEVVWTVPQPSTRPASPAKRLSRTVHFREPVHSTLDTPLAKPKLSVRVDEVDDFPLERLENVTAISRSLIPADLLNPPRPRRQNLLLQKHKMATAVTTASKNSMPQKNSKHKSLRKRLSLASKKKPENRDEEADTASTGKHSVEEKRPAVERGRSSRSSSRNDSENASLLSTGSEATEATPIKSNRSGRATSPKQRGGVLQRLRSVSRSRSRSRKTETQDEPEHKAMLVAVTSCKSDAYYNQKAPGSTSKLPRKAPSNLKLFHELAVGVKDAYSALGATPEKPDPEAEVNGRRLTTQELSARTTLWEFVGNLDFLLALVDEVAVDTATRGALKDDTTFKCLRDVIKKCNKILEGMLVRRERKYTLFFRLVQPHEKDDIEAIRSWNSKVEKAVGAVADSRSAVDDDSDTASDTVSNSSHSTDASGASARKSMFTRGRQLLPTAGRVRARRATPTPRLRQHRKKEGASTGAVAAEDGFSTVNTPVTSGNLAMLQRSFGVSDSARSVMQHKPPKQQLATAKPVQPKDELVDVIRGLREEKLKSRDASTTDSELATLKPDWLPKADIPSALPKLPFEYIHRHRLMKQVVNCLCDNSGAGPRDTDDETPSASFITSITSRHGDKAGNGKTTLAVASIQTVEVRERFPDGIGWVHLGRNPLVEKDIRRLYDELYRQLFDRDEVSDRDSIEGSSDDKAETASHGGSSLGSLDDKGGGKSEAERDVSIQIASARRRFQGGDLEAIKEELGELIAQRKILICLDDVWRVEDAKWFIFDELVTKSVQSPDSNQCRILVTTRTPSLLGAGVVQEVFVRIFSEHEAVKLLLSSAGRRPYGGKNSAVFNQARGIVKGCGNTPLAVRIAGGMLRHNNRNWNLSSPIWKALLDQCRMSLEEASRLRSFVHSVSRIVDLSFLSMEDLALRCSMRRCLVTFASVFGEHEWVLIGRGIPQSVILKLFGTVIDAGLDEACRPPAKTVLDGLEAVHLLQRARHGCHVHRSDFASDKIDSGGETDTPDDDSLDFVPARALPFVSVDNTAFVISDAVKAVSERMAERRTLAYLPIPDEYTSFTEDIEKEKVFVQQRGGRGPLWTAPFRHFASQLSQGTSHETENLDDSEMHDLVVGSLLNARSATRPILEAFRDTNTTGDPSEVGGKFEEYLTTFIPAHLIRAQSLSFAAEFLVDEGFIRRRVRALGVVQATRRQVTDLLELRRESGHAPPPKKAPVASNDVDRIDLEVSPVLRHATSEEYGEGNVDGSAVLRDGCRLIIEEVFTHEHDALDRALCLSLVGDGLLKGKQQRDAMLRLEESLGIYRSILGNTGRSIDVARSLNAVARAVAKIGETRVALLKFAEATRIYDACNANLQHDAIANAQNYASLLVDVGDWSSADAKFEEVFSAKKTVYGANSVPVAKAINSYAILLAKYGRMDKALAHYVRAMAIYKALTPPLIHDPEFDMKCKYDLTLINLNIASIRSKKGDLNGAITSYEDGVKGLHEHAEEQEKLRKAGHVGEAVRSASQHKHLVAALGRIGSLKLKMGNFEGALEAYSTLLEEVNDNSPATSRVEKAKAHIKCATIYRQFNTKESRIKSISHLREALEMYTALFGADHKDTTAIASSLRQWLAEDRQSRIDN